MVSLDAKDDCERQFDIEIAASAERCRGGSRDHQGDLGVREGLRWLLRSRDRSGVELDTGRASGMTTSEGSDRQQAVVLDMLRRARGAPVSFARLKEAGVEFPASVVVELELAGIAVARCRIDAGGARHAAAVRLDPERDPAHASPTDRDDRYPVGPAHEAVAPIALARARVPAISARRWATRAALLVFVGVLATGALLSLTGPAGVAPSRARPHLVSLPASSAGEGKKHRTTAAHQLRLRAHQPRPKSAHIHRSAPPPVSAAEAWTLDIRGHDLLLARDYGQAITALRAATAATGEHLAACRQPTTETCLVYGYALYDIGQALLRGGHPSAAVAVFQRRLLIDNQLPVVEAALTVARTQAT